MSPQDDKIQQLYQATETDPHLQDPETAHLVIHENEVLGKHEVTGLSFEAQQKSDGIDLWMTVARDHVIQKPVHLCFGLLPAEGEQHINMRVRCEPGSQVNLLAHCVFPAAVNVRHIMDADIEIGENASYSYTEKHVHSLSKGIDVVPHAKIRLAPGAQFYTEFELIKGRVGRIDIDYETHGEANSRTNMVSKISGREDDDINVNETAYLKGEGARGALVTKVAVRDQARATVRNTMIASAPDAQGHVDCKEIVRDHGVATAIPIVEVRHPRAHVTHEAAIGSVDHKQLETLMSRGLDEDRATDMIINSMLSGG
jgi:hypothetical protein